MNHTIKGILFAAGFVGLLSGAWLLMVPAVGLLFAAGAFKQD